MLVKLLTGRDVGKVVEMDDADATNMIDQGQATASVGKAIEALVEKSTQAFEKSVETTITKSVDEALTRFLAAQAGAKKHATPAIFGEGGDGDHNRCFGDWLHHAIKAIAGKGREPYQAAEYLEKKYPSSVRRKAALAEGSGVTGGYTVPVEFSSKIMEMIVEDTFFRKHAFVQPMDSATLLIPYLDVATAQSSGASATLGGMQAVWTAEAATRSEYEPAFRQLELKAHELSAYSVSSNVLIQDSAIGLEKFLMRLFAKVIGWTEEYAFLRGNGAGKPQGILNAAALISTTRDTSAHIKYADIANMISRLLPSSLGRAIWAAHPYCLTDLLQLRDASNRLVWVNALAGAQDKVPGYLFGRPVYLTEKLPALGTNGDILLFDPSLYVIGDRMTLEVAASEHVNFLKNQMTWRVVSRVDGQPWVASSITLADASSTVSPYVAVAT